MIKAVIVEVDHRDVTSLGLQLAADEFTFGTLDENAITALTQLTLLEEEEMERPKEKLESVREQLQFVFKQDK